MKNLLCYFGIIFLFSLFIFPIVLRIALPDKKNEKKDDINSNYILSCSNKEFLIKTSYVNKNINMIIIQKTISEEVDKRTKLDEGTENVDEQLIDNKNKKVKYQEIIDLFDKIKDKASIIHNASPTEELVSIDFSITDHKDLGLDNITKGIEEQKAYYENIEFTCNIT